MFWKQDKEVTVAFTFLIPASATRSVFKVIQERTNPTETSFKDLADGQVLVRVTRKIPNSTAAIELNKNELISDLGGYRAVFQYWKYHLVSVDGKTKNKRISVPSKFLTWLTPPPDARNYVKYRMPFYSFAVLLALGFIVVWVV